MSTEKIIKRLGIAVFLLVAYVIGYRVGQNGADRWYSRHWFPPEQFEKNWTEIFRSDLLLTGDGKNYCYDGIHRPWRARENGTSIICYGSDAQ